MSRRLAVQSSEMTLYNRTSVEQCLFAEDYSDAAHLQRRSASRPTSPLPCLKDKPEQVQQDLCGEDACAV